MPKECTHPRTGCSNATQPAYIMHTAGLVPKRTIITLMEAVFYLNHHGRALSGMLLGQIVKGSGIQ